MSEDPKRKGRCEAVQLNLHAPDFTCKFNAGHGGPHVDPKTSTSWMPGQRPVGVRRRPAQQSYRNPKLHRRSHT